MKKTEIDKNIDRCIKNGVNETMIRAMLFELWQTDVIRFDDAGNPYWESCGERLDGKEDLEFND